jgi:hypothetical protein
MLAVFVADVEEHLQSEADAEERPAALDVAEDWLIRRRWRKVATASWKAPTPGSTILSARSISSGLEMMCAAAPTCSKPFCTERRLAMS